MVMPTGPLDHIGTVPFAKKQLFGNQHHGASWAKELIGEAFRSRVENIDHDSCAPGDEDTFFVADLGEVYRQYLRWKLNLPRVKPFYAVKCNPDMKVLELLSGLGAGFDCASKTEVEQVLGLGVDPSRIVYAQPCKTNSYVRYIRTQGVRQTTFDNADELYKIAKLYPEAELFLRILSDDSNSLCKLSMKFGASMDTTDDLLALAAELGLNVVGVSFHIGSSATDPTAFYTGVRDAHAVFAQAAAHGFTLRALDVGGGFCSDSSFEVMAGILRAALDEFFPPHRGVSIIAEPGRYFVSRAFTIACNIIARRAVGPAGLRRAAGPGAPSAEPRYRVYINDGLYGNFSGIMFDHQHPQARILRAGPRFLYDSPDDEAAAKSGDGIDYSVWGPTCDGIDRIAESVCFAHALDVGDWLYFEDMGAYTRCSATRFNGFSDNHDVIYVCSEPAARAVMRM